MTHNAKIAGRLDSLSRFGAQQVLPRLKALPGAVKSNLIGDPSRALTEFNSNSLMKPGGMLREALVPKGKAHAMLMYGLPALQLYSASQAPEQERGSLLGSTAGSLAGGMLGSPLGMLGTTAGSILGSSFGKNIGSTFDNKITPY